VYRKKKLEALASLIASTYGLMFRKKRSGVYIVRVTLVDGSM
jgi:hypothetical protein